MAESSGERRRNEHGALDERRARDGGGHSERGEFASEAVSELFRQHASAVEAVARGLTRDAHLAADVCQNVFAKAVTRFDQIPEGAARAWLLRVASNESIDVLRKQGREKRHTQASAVPGRHETGDGASAATDKEQNELIGRVVASLPDLDREIVRRRFELGQTFAEIASEIDKPLGTVLSRAHRLMKTLQSRLSELHEQ